MPFQRPLPGDWWVDPAIWKPYKHDSELHTNHTQWQALWNIYQDARRKEGTQTVLTDEQDECLRHRTFASKQPGWNEQRQLEYTAMKCNMGTSATYSMLEDISRIMSYQDSAYREASKQHRQIVREVVRESAE